MADIQHHVLNAIEHLKKARIEVDNLSAAGESTPENFGKHVDDLLQAVSLLQRSVITAKIKSGMPTKLVAEQHGISPSRVSQIAPRRT